MNNQNLNPQPTANSSSPNPHSVAALQSLTEILDLFRDGQSYLEGRSHQFLSNLSNTLLAAKHSLGNVVFRTEIDDFRFPDGRPLPGLDRDYLNPSDDGVGGKCRYLEHEVIPFCIALVADYLGRLLDQPSLGRPPAYHLQQMLPLLK